jgi:hypothetical protein
MRTALAFLLMLGLAEEVSAQSAVDFAASPLLDGPAIGIQITPALDGFTNAWLMSSLRFSTPLGSRLGFDVEAGRVFGGTTELPASSAVALIKVRSFYSTQLRFMRGTRGADGTGAYFLAGLQLLAVEKFDHDGMLVADELTSQALLGFGFDQLFGNRTRVSAEVGLSGGDGLIPYLAIGIQWRMFR